MAGHGPGRKDDDKRARRNKDAPALRVVENVEPTQQPKLPQLMLQYLDVLGNVRRRRVAWPAQTKAWWQMWADSPLSDDFTSTDWSELLDTARLHAEFWCGNTKVAAELRQRVAKFGATPEDRVRLRIQFAMAKNAENPSPPRTPTAQHPEQSGDNAGADATPRGPRRLTG